MRVIVVGGGVIGCATAWELARRGCEVVLVERATPGAEASGAAAGLLAPLGELGDTPLARLALESWRLYPTVAAELHDLTRVDVELATRGTIYPLLTVEDIRRAGVRAARASSRVFAVEAWDAEETRRREPALGPEVRGAMFVSADHWVNNQRLVVGYAQAAAAAGARVLAGRTVSRVLVEGGRARGVVAERETIEGDAVLLAAGAWTGALVASFGADLPVEPRRGQILALSHVPPVLRHCVHGDDVYLVPRPSGELLVGATVERVGFHRAVTAEGIGGLLNAAIRLVPALGDLAITRTWYGFRPWARDGLPVLGPWPGVDGVWVATAHFRNGILLAPITARLMAEWILDGQPSLSLKDFLPDRYARG